MLTYPGRIVHLLEETVGRSELRSFIKKLYFAYVRNIQLFVGLPLFHADNYSLEVRAPASLPHEGQFG